MLHAFHSVFHMFYYFDYFKFCLSHIEAPCLSFHLKNPFSLFSYIDYDFSLLKLLPAVMQLLFEDVSDNKWRFNLSETPERLLSITRYTRANAPSSHAAQDWLHFKIVLNVLQTSESAARRLGQVVYVCVLFERNVGHTLLAYSGFC